MKSWISAVLFVVVALSIWKANNGDVNQMVDSIWAILNKAADFVTALWNKFMSLSV